MRQWRDGIFCCVFLRSKNESAFYSIGLLDVRSLSWRFVEYRGNKIKHLTLTRRRQFDIACGQDQGAYSRRLHDWKFTDMTSELKQHYTEANSWCNANLITTFKLPIR